MGAPPYPRSHLPRSCESASAATRSNSDTRASISSISIALAAWLKIASAARTRTEGGVLASIAILNSLAGEKPVKKLKDAKTAIVRIWERIQGLAEPAKAEPTKPRADKKRKAGAQAARGASAKTKATKKTASAKNAPKAKKAAKPAKAESGPREGSKTAQVVAMLQRKNGATLAEIMDKMGWQRHTVRGFMAGAMKKAGYAVESFKPEGGERTYRINA